MVNLLCCYWSVAENTKRLDSTSRSRHPSSARDFLESRSMSELGLGQAENVLNSSELASISGKFIP